MHANEIIIDAFNRIKEVVHDTVPGLSAEQLEFRPGDKANSIGWMIWHLTRIQDDHISDVSHAKQIWDDGWFDKFQLPYDIEATGYGQSSEEVAAFQADSRLLLGYYDAVHEATLAYVQTLTEEDYERVVDSNWNPPVTLAVRLVSVIADDLQHAGQAAYTRGLLDG